MTESNPKMVEISEGDLAVLKQARGLLEGLWNNPEQGAKFKRLLKESNPKLSIPEIDIIDQARKPVDEKLSAQEKELNDLKARIEKKEKDDADRTEEQKLKEEMNEVKKKYNLTEDGFNKMVDRMKEKKSYDPEAAAAWVVSRETKAKPAEDSRLGLPGKIDLYGSSKKDKDWEELHKDPMQYFDNTVRDVLENPENSKEFGGQL